MSTPLQSAARDIIARLPPRVAALFAIEASRIVVDDARYQEWARRSHVSGNSMEDADIVALWAKGMARDIAWRAQWFQRDVTWPPTAWLAASAAAEAVYHVHRYDDDIVVYCAHEAVAQAAFAAVDLKRRFSLTAIEAAALRRAAAPLTI